MTYIEAIFLGLIEGLTEFIPVSSTGHLILAIQLLKLHTPPGKVFEVVIQMGAILAICWLYRQKIWQLCKGLFASDTRSHSLHFAWVIILGVLPAIVLGALFHGMIKALLFSPWVVSISLVLGGILILIIEKLPKSIKFHAIESISWKRALMIGFCQALAMIPGVSRSGATIMGALCLGVERKVATELSFFLAIPTMMGAASYDLYKNYALLSNQDYSFICLGFMSAFIAALFVVKWVIAFITRYGFGIFGVYRIFLGILMMIILFFKMNS